MVGPNGEQVGIVRIEDALRLAQESDLDLVEVAPNAKPPVCKLMDFGKYKYEAAVKARESRKNQTNTVLKEVRFRLKIDSHDYETKKKNALKFLSQGDKVKAMIQFRGREQQRPEFGIRLLQKFAEDVAEVGTVESAPRQDGRNMVMVVGPLRTKADAKAEARREAKANGTDKAARRRERQQRVDTSAPQVNVSNSVGDAMPEALKAMAKAEPAAAPAPKAEAPKAAAPKVEAPKAAAAKAEAPKAAAPKVEAPKAAAKPATSKPAAAKPAAAKPAASKAAAAKPAASGTAKPAAPKPATPKPGASAPKPTPRPAPKPAPMPGPRSGK
ncbi:MAG: translation initiation factor IF-3 [Galactobacter sp.]